MSAKEASRSTQLQRALKTVDGLSQVGFDRIEAMALLALGAFESPRGLTTQALQQVARVLGAIAFQAELTRNDINVEAEHMGCNYVDERGRRQHAAICKKGGAA